MRLHILYKSLNVLKYSISSLICKVEKDTQIFYFPSSGLLQWLWEAAIVLILILKKKVLFKSPYLVLRILAKTKADNEWLEIQFTSTL